MSDIPDLLERFRRGAELLSVATTGVGNAELDFVPGAGRWSIRQIAAHLADAECVGAMRLRQVIAENDPLIVAYDEKAWSDRLNYSKRKISAILESFRRVRADNYELLKDLPEEAYARSGRHSERGPMTLRDIVRIYAEHAENHVKQIMDVRQAFKSK
ncbi:MAG: DinB family protein [Bryobacteraceae bacterium]